MTPTAKCETCKFFEDCLTENDYITKDDTCEAWEQDRTDEELEAQRTDAAERENHRREVEE